MLAEAGANFSRRDERFFTPLYNALLHGVSKPTFDLIMAKNLKTKWPNPPRGRKCATIATFVTDARQATNFVDSDHATFEYSSLHQREFRDMQHKGFTLDKPAGTASKLTSIKFSVIYHTDVLEIFMDSSCGMARLTMEDEMGSLFRTRDLHGTQLPQGVRDYMNCGRVPHGVRDYIKW